MDYETRARSQTLAEQPDLERPYLARLGSIEAELANCADHIEEFIARFRGGGFGATQDGPTAPVASGHAATIDRIVEQMTRIDKASRELSTIG